MILAHPIFCRDGKEMIAVKSCGLILFREVPNSNNDNNSDNNNQLQFLLMKHPNRYDLPKGHQEEGEDDYQTAMREFNEETGLQARLYTEESSNNNPDNNKKGDSNSTIEIDKDFVFEEVYYPVYRRFGGPTVVQKTLKIFLARVKGTSIIYSYYCSIVVSYEYYMI